MRKITKKEGQTLLINNKSKFTLNSWSTLEDCMELLWNISLDRYNSCLDNIEERIAISSDNSKMVFQTTEGKSWLEGLNNTNWYIEEVHGTSMVIIDFNCKGEETVLGYTLV